MKIVALVALMASASLAGCSSDGPTEVPDDLAPSFASGSGSDGSGGGDDSGGSGSGSTTTTGPIQNVFVGQGRLVSGDTSSVLVSTTQVAPAGGYTLSLRSSDPAVQVPATYVVPAGEFVVHVPLSTAPIADARVFRITVSLLG